MSSPHRGSKRRRTAGLLVFCLLGMSTAGCSSLGGLFGGDDDTILPGERVAVIPSDQPLTADPDAGQNPVVVPAAYTNTDWSQPGGSPSNALQHLALGGKLSKLWQSSAGTGSSSQGRLTASPIVVGNRVYTLDTEATVHAFDITNGSRLWRAELTPEDEESEEGYGGGLAASNGKIFAAIGFGHVVALDPANGNKLWDKSLGAPVRTAPTAADGRVFITTVNNEVYSLNQQDGEIAWKFQGVAETAALLSSTSPAVSGGMVVVPYTSGELVAFSAGDGNPRWSDSLTKAGALSSLANMNDIAGRPVIEGDTVFAVSHAGRLAAFSLKTGERIWGQDISSTETPWVAGNYLFLVNEQGVLMALSRKDGKIRWVRQLGSDAQWSGPVLAGGRLILVSSTGTVASVSPESGTVIDQIKVGGGMMISPVVAGNTIYFYTDDADLIAMR
jgi:outer membrane protein assembly factor BamB